MTARGAAGRGKGLTGANKEILPSASSLRTGCGPTAGGPSSSAVDPPVRGSVEPRSGSAHARAVGCAGWKVLPRGGGVYVSVQVHVWVQNPKVKTDLTLRNSSLDRPLLLLSKDVLV